jgi:hypothetical protein
MSAGDKPLAEMPCPFCGGPPTEFADTDYGGLWRITCEACDMGSVRIEDWNRRAASAGMGWTEVTDDPATWPQADMPGPVLAECQSPLRADEHYTHTFDEAFDVRRNCAPDAYGRVLRWMPWPSAAPADPDADEWAAWSCWCGAKGSGEKDYRRHKDNVHAAAGGQP